MKKRNLLFIWILDIAFIASLFGIVALWIFQPVRVDLLFMETDMSMRLRYFLLPLLLITVRVILRKSVASSGDGRFGPMEHTLLQGAVLCLSSVILFVGLLEKGLAIAGYSAEMPPIIFELTDASGVTEQNQGYADPELIFAFRKGEKYHGVTINSLGYREREVDLHKAPGAMRVICMGDSVTAQGNPGYCGILNDLLTASPPTPQAWEAFNMAVYGYSSVQGLRVFQLQTKDLKPDIVTLYYGWNDHWLEMQKDRDRMARKTGKLYSAIYELFKSKRSFMLMHNLVIHGDTGSMVRKEPGFRVPPEDYQNTLRRFVAEIREAKAIPILITAPRRDAVPSLKRHGNVLIDYNAVHDEYAEYTRQVATELDVDLLDLHQKFSSPEYDVYFSNDGIHFHQEGLKKIADALDQKIRQVITKK